MGNFKPNHICANSKCPYGENGKPKEYYACDACDRKSYRVLACSPECYAEVIKHINGEYDVKPQRIDKTPEEVDALMAEPIEEVEARSMSELSEFKSEIETQGLEAVVDKINVLIDEEAKSKRKSRKKKSGSDN